jgi:polar amino acid transport system substrate-binding protein
MRRKACGTGGLSFIAAVTLLTVVAGQPARASSLAEVKARGELVVLSFPHSTSEFVRRKGDVYEGLDYEMMRTFAAAHKVELTVRPVPKFSSLIPWLLEGKGDVIASAFSITEERRKVVDYSDSYFPVIIMIVSRKGVVIGDAADFTDRKAAVVPGTSREAFIKKKVTGVTIIPVEKTRLAYDAILAGKADYAPVDSTSAMTDLKDYPDLEVVFSFPDKMGYGFAVKKDSDLATALSEHIERLRASGIFYKMLSRVFGPQAVELVKSIERGSN